ncbi:MAG: hypothetical protein ABT940_14060, partial [Alphaproteobacteria bacterium]
RETNGGFEMINWWLRRLLDPKPSDSAGNPQGDPAADGGQKPDQKPPTPDPKTGEPADDPKTKEAREEAIKERHKRQGLEKTIAELKAEQESLKKNLGKALGLVKDDDDPVKAAASATEKAVKLEERLRQTIVESALIGELAKKGAIDPVRAAKLVAMDSLKVDLDKGTVEGAADAVAALLKDAPYLMKVSLPPPGGGAPPSSDPNPKGATQEEYDKLKKAASSGDPAAQLQLAQGLSEFRKAGIKL